MAQYDYNRNLRRFSEMDNVEVSKEDPDIRGWDVTSADGQDLGEVKDLLVDTATMKVHAVEVELEGSRFNWNDNRRVVVPVDTLRINRDDDEVVISGMRKEEVGTLPIYDPSWTRGTDDAAFGKRPEDRFDETAGHAGYGAEGYARSSEEIRGGEREHLTRAEEELQVGKRDVHAGEVRVGKHVETEHVRQPVSLERERVNVERRPATGDVTNRDARFKDEEVVIPITEEEAVVEKRPVVKEEVVISKERVRDEDTVEADLRKERLDIKQEGRAFDDKSRPNRKGGR
ncbi:MAG TPA: PRC and DUF2382 domain-containing protein [Vicinamibacterales bacterium]|nr:PRC and DUF2382 domain-containing protein [Vicinamibacterales bacterium]